MNTIENLYLANVPTFATINAYGAETNKADKII